MSTECCTYECENGQDCPVRAGCAKARRPEAPPRGMFREMIYDLLTIAIAIGLIIWLITTFMGTM